MIRAVFFDLDGTLLPMDMREFVDGYSALLCEKVAPLGIEPCVMVKGLWQAVGAMAGNDGSRVNADVYWSCFEQTTGFSRSNLEPVCDRFYAEEFHQVSALCGENPLAREAVRLAGLNGRTVALATNPIFPRHAQLSRLSWIGLGGDDFAAITDYTNSRFCKPASGYYLELCRQLGLRPQEVLMVGNDERQDMYGASAVGMRCYLVTDCMITRERFPWKGDRGSFAELPEYLRRLE